MGKEIKFSEYLDFIKNHPDFGQAYVYHRYLPPNDAEYGPDLDVHPELLKTLKKGGMHNLYIHQTKAIKFIRQGENVIIATPTASGKSLIYNLTVLEAILTNNRTKALYIFPLKALEQDQLKNLKTFLKNIRGKRISVGIYDGDTSPYRRKQIRAQVPDILFTNPDMLHQGILAYHDKWKDLFENLSYVVLDEVHTYRGIFGSHMNQIIKRLRRICGLYGADPQFILLSATVNNPHEFGMSLLQDNIRVINSSGSPRSGQYFLFLNPEASPNFSAARLFANSIQSGFRTIAFTQSRKVTELIHLWTSQLSPALREKVSSYRAGFMPEERRDIERRLAKGDLLGVVSTSALEMGIDIGYLDVCLLVGYPGTIINTWQRSGRVGRSGRESMIILLGKPDALDQYFMRHPDDLFNRSYEAAILDPHNPYVVKAHLPCAADEVPVTLKDNRFWTVNLTNHLDELEMDGELTRAAEGNPTWYSTHSRPHRLVNIRSSGESYTIFETTTGQAIGSIDGIRALKECHPGAIYLHRARQYLVERLDLDHKDIIARESDLQYFTRVRSEKDTEIIHVNRSRPEGQFIVREGLVKVTERIIGYEKRSLPGQELMGIFPLELPQHTFETIGFWVEIEPMIDRLIEEKDLHLMGGIHAIEHGAIGIFPLFALCDRNDIGGICYTYHPQIGKSAIFIYDGYPGGVGLAQKGFEIVFNLFEKTLDHIRSCKCDEGCPSCIHSPKCGSGNKPLDKGSAVNILEFLVGRIPLSRFYDPDVEKDSIPMPIEKGHSFHDKEEPKVIYLDLETQKLAQEVGGWQNSHLMRVSVVVIYDSLEKEFLSFTEDRVNDLFVCLDKADLIVGFNIKRFDYAVLSAYTSRKLADLPTFDLLEDIYKRLGFRLGLDHLAKETINQRKSADGLQAVEWFRQGEMEKLTSYCRQDVAATRDLFLFGLDEGHLIYRTKKENKRVRLPVDWNLDKMIKEK